METTLSKEAMWDIGFHIVVTSSPLEYERLVAEINFKGDVVAVIQQERGIGCFDIELEGPALGPSGKPRIVDLEGFLQAIQFAKKALSTESA